MLSLGRLKHDLGYRLVLDIQAAVNTAAYGYDDMPLGEPLALAGQAENIAGEIHVSGQLSANLVQKCSRCGTAVHMELSLPFREIYSSQDVPPDEAGEQDKHAFSGTNIDLTPEALRALFAELPMKPLCREDCRGLCPQCGADLNLEQCSCGSKEIDLRWEKLRNLLNDEAGKGV